MDETTRTEEQETEDRAEELLELLDQGLAANGY